MLATVRSYRVPYQPGELSNGKLAGLVYRYGRCAVSPVDPDEWFPISQDVAAAREQAADAIAVCEVCPVRAECLEFSLRHGSGFGAYGVWGGLVEADRRSLRRRWLGGTSVTELLSGTVEARETSHQHQGDRQRDHRPGVDA